MSKTSKKRSAKKESFLYDLFRVAKMMFKASPFWMIILQAVAILYGLTCGFQVIVTRTFFDAIAEQAGRGQGILSLLWQTLSFGGILLLVQLLSGIDQFLKSPAITAFELAFKTAICEKTTKMNPIDFESSDFLDSIYKAPRNIFVMVQAPLIVLRIFTFYIPYFGITAGFYFSLQPELVFSILAIFIPSLFTLVARNKFYADLDNTVAPLWRRYEYMEKTIGDREYFKETRLLGAFGLLRGIYVEAISILNKRIWKTEKKMVLIETGLRLLTLSGYIGILWLLFTYLLDGKITVGAFAAVFSSIGMVISFMEDIVVNNMGYVSYLSRYLRYYVQYLDLPEREGVIQVPESSEMELKNVTFRYPGRDSDTIRGISLSIKEGETIAVVGDNGAGKTTLIRLLSGLYLPKEGQVLIGGVDTKQVSSKSIYKSFSAVFQNYQRYQSTLKDNVIASKPENENPSEALEKADVEVQSSTFPDGLDTMLSREFDGVDISGGQWQRVAIARGYHREHGIILLDEPTAAIDPIEESKIYSQFTNISKDKTAIIVTHRMGSAKIADRIVVMKDGVIDDIGNHDELVRRKGHYADMWAAQAKWYE